MALWKDINYIKMQKGYILEDIPDLYQALYALFKTKKGQRLFRPNYGADMSRYLFEPCDEMTARSMLYDLKTAIQQEPRVQLNMSNTFVVPDPTNRQFIIQLSLNVPDLGKMDEVLTFTFQQKG